MTLICDEMATLLCRDTPLVLMEELTEVLTVSAEEAASCCTTLLSHCTCPYRLCSR